MNDEAEKTGYASPPCFMHEITADGTVVSGGDADEAAWRDVVRWRKAERERLIAARLVIPADERAAMAEAIGRHLNDLIGDIRGRMVSLYWPFRGEPDMRPWMQTVNDRGGRTALPIVVEKGAPLVFRAYKQGDRLERGVWNIPIPAEGDEVLPDVVIAPVVGFAKNYRLGYGGGFFDRTLAAMPRKPLVVGIGYAMQEIASIFPQPHDIPMNTIVTERGVQSAQD
jgi:5,10-methenyltetrahydrofolate synthetase